MRIDSYCLTRCFGEEQIVATSVERLREMAPATATA